MTQETAFALLGALIAVAFVMLCALAFGGWVGVKLVRYLSRFRGMQVNRNENNEMMFGGKIDESPLAEGGYREAMLPPSDPELPERELQ